MRSLVIYGTRSGNTRRVADAIAEALRAHGTVELLAAEDVPAVVPHETELVVVGGPTEGHGATPQLLDLFERIGPSALEGMAAAAFDTRLRIPRLLSGSAATRIGQRLRRSGATLIAEPESFFVHGREPELEPGELERARAWATTLPGRVSGRQSPVAAGEPG